MIKLFLKHITEDNNQFILKKIQSIFNLENLPIIFKNDNGKPIILYENDIFVNISYSGEYCAFVVSNHNIGIDIELIRNVNFKIMDKIFFKCEREYINNSINKTQEFLKIWTKKESYSKYTGFGLRQIKKINTFSPKIKHNFRSFILSSNLVCTLYCDNIKNEKIEINIFI